MSLPNAVAPLCNLVSGKVAGLCRARFCRRIHATATTTRQSEGAFPVGNALGRTRGPVRRTSAHRRSAHSGYRHRGRESDHSERPARSGQAHGPARRCPKRRGRGREVAVFDEARANEPPHLSVSFGWQRLIHAPPHSFRPAWFIGSAGGSCQSRLAGGAVAGSADRCQRVAWRDVRAVLRRRQPSETCGEPGVGFR